MVRLTKITTKMGDKGTTMLGNGEFVAKCHPRINAYGTVDELGAVLGMVISCGLLETQMVTILQMIQQDLFNLGSVLCRPHDEDVPPRHPITQAHIDFLETHIEDFNQYLPALESFILSGGTEASARLHLARTITRRAEREVNFLASTEHVPNLIGIYLNRLSDLLFILARNTNKRGEDDILWCP